MAISDIEVKLVSYIEQDGSLIIAFRKQGSNEDFDNCPTFSYQPSVFSVDNVDSLLREIAKSGSSVLENYEKQKEFINNQAFVDSIKLKISSVTQYNVASLFQQ